MVRYYGHYSNVSRGRCKKARIDDQIPYILEPELSPKELRKNWARLIQKIVTRPGRYPNTVKAHSVLSYWAAWELGLTPWSYPKALTFRNPRLANR
jgi:hypothetical protein